MKYLFFLLTLVASGADAQTTTGRVKWKSASNANYIYTGEIKDGKPNGRGLAVSDPEGDKIVFAEFKDGMIDGRAVISQNTGAISVINYKENKPEGIGLIISPNGDLVYGNLAKDFFGEKATMVYADNTIAFGSVKNGKLNGRVISINSEGNIMEDRFYINDKANGPGYRYELESKELFEGVWENDKWVKDTTGNYPSFMPNPNFGSLVNSDA